jgi:hypothetical protein
MRIELHIERLVLDEALMGGERAAMVSDAITWELARRLAHPDAAQALLGLDNVASQRPIALPPPRHPGDRLGPRIAHAVQQLLELPAGPGDAGGRGR